MDAGLRRNWVKSCAEVWAPLKRLWGSVSPWGRRCFRSGSSPRQKQQARYTSGALKPASPFILTNFWGLACALVRVDSWLWLRKCPIWDLGYRRWRRDFRCDTTARLLVFPLRRQKNNSGLRWSRQTGACAPQSELSSGECWRRPHALVCAVTVKGHSRCPHHSLCVTCQRLKACYFPKYPSRTFTSWLAWMNGFPVWKTWSPVLPPAS